MGHSTTEDQHQTQNVTQTPTNPAYVDSTLAHLTGNVDNLASADPYSFVAGPSALQTQSGTTAAGLSGLPWQYAGATDLTNGVAQENSPSILGHLDEFMTPYLSDVIKSTMQGFDQNAALTNAQTALNRAQDTTFGGSGGAITDALTRGQLAMDRGNLLANLRNQGYSQALGAATNQAQLDQQTQAQRLAAAGQLADIATNQQGTQRANAGTQASEGSILQGLDQARAGAPLTVASSLSSILGGLPLNLEHGQNTNGVTDSHSTTTTSDPLGTIGSLAMLAAAPFTGGASLLGGLGGLSGAASIGAGLGSLSGLANGMGGFTGLSNIAGNLANNDPTGMWRFH